MIATVLDIIIGPVTFSGSLIAAGKLQGWVSSRPVVFPGARLVTAALAGRTRVLWPTWAAVVAFCAVWLGLGGRSPLRSLEGATGAYSAHGVLIWILQQAGERIAVGIESLGIVARRQVEESVDG